MSEPTEQIPDHTVRTASAPMVPADNVSSLVAPDFALNARSRREDRAALLAKVVHDEILPRLAEARAVPVAVRRPNARVEATTESDTQQLVGLLLAHPAIDAIAFVEGFRQRGVTPACLYLGIVTQAAQCLGTLWEEDHCGFADVTIGLCHLQQVVRALSPAFQVAALVKPHADTILLAPAPGEQHTLGLVLLSEFFRRDGWFVAGGPNTTSNEAVATARDSWVDVAGFSIGSTHRLGGLAACIAAVRRASRNRDIYVIVGGPMLLTHPDLAQRTGADTAAADAQCAVQEARGLLQFRAAAD